VGLVDSNNSGNNGLYSGLWNPGDSLTPGTYVVYANAINVPYYHNYTSSAPNSTTSVYGKLNATLELTEHIIYRHNSYNPYTSVFIANVSDENGQSVASANVNFTIDTTTSSNVTDSSGLTNYTYDPENTKTPNNYSVTLNASKQYYWRSDDVSSLIVKGVLIPNITLPTNGTKFYRGSIIEMNSSLVDENSQTIIADSYNWTLKETLEDLGNSSNSTWTVPNNHGIGTYTINLTVTKKYYDVGFDEINIDIFGNSSVEIITVPQTLYRGNSVLYQANVTDVNGSALSNYNCSWWVDDVYIEDSLTGPDGICNYTFNPACSYNVGVHEINVTITSKNSSYYDPTASNDNASVTIKDVLGITINEPVANQIIHRTENVSLNSTVSDYCGAPPTDSYSVIWLNETNGAIASGEVTSWIVPTNHNLGISNISANVSGSYYDFAINTTVLYVYGWSKVNNITPNSGSYLRGELVTFNCTIIDANTSETLTNYPVEFLKNGISQINTTTNGQGVANWTWNTTSESPEFYNIACRIDSNASLYYNVSESNKTANIEVESRLNIDDYNIDNATIYRNDLYSPYASNISIKVTESALGPIENAIVHVYTPDGEQTCNTTTSGWCSVVWNPTNTLTPDNYTIYINATKSGYTASNTETPNIIVRGKLSTSVVTPSTGSYHKGDVLQLQSVTYDENNNQVGTMPTITWINSNGTQIKQATGWTTNDYWTIPLNYSLGNDTLYANATRQWFDSGVDGVDIVVWGYSNTSWISPNNGDYTYGQILPIWCFVQDVNMSEGIGNYTVMFYYNDTFIGVNNTNGSGYAVYNWEPVALGSYNLRCRINDSNSLYYNVTLSEGNESVTISDHTEPTLQNVSIIPSTLETHQNLVFRANVTDDINISVVWVNVVKPDNSSFNLTLNKIAGSEYNISSSYPVLYGAIYNVTYSPDLGGYYNVTFYVNDSFGNTRNSNLMQFEAIPTTNITAELLPEIISIENITQTANSSFRMNVTCTNIGNATAYNSEIGLTLPSGWTANESFPYDCGDISSNANCFVGFIVTIPEKEDPGNYDIIVNCSWMNPDYTNDSRTDNSTVTVTSNPILDIVESVVNTVVLHNNSNITTFNVSSIGNDNLTGINFSCSSGIVCGAFNVEFSTNNVNLTAGGSQLITVNVSVPVGYAPGTYYGEILANATGSSCYNDNCWDNVSLKVVVPTSKTWYRNPSSLSDKSVYVNASGFYGNITINNTANVALDFNISATGNISSLLVFDANMTIAKQSGDVLIINYSIPLTQNPGTYVGNIVITAEDGSVPVQSNTSVSLTVSDNIDPVISGFAVLTPSSSTIADLNYEVVSFEANVSDNIGLKNVWVCDDSGSVSEFGCQAMTNVGGNTYQYNYTHSQSGIHTIYIFARDTSNNDALSSTEDYRIVSTTNGKVMTDPSNIEISDITYYDNSSFVLNVTFNNTGEGGAYGTNISLSLPNSNFTANSTFENCGKVDEVNVSGFCSKSFLITVLKGTPAGIYNITVYSNWSNPDNSLGSAYNITQVNITDKTWERIPSQISKTLYVNTSGEYGQINVSNTGALPIYLNISYTGNGSSLINISNSSLYLSSGESYNLTVNYSVPINKPLGQYNVVISISNSSYYPPQRNTSLIITVADNILPDVENSSLSKSSLEANYQNLTISVDAYDNINISKVWAEIKSPYYTRNVEMNHSSGNGYSVEYVPTRGGQHNVTIYANDTSNNLNSVYAGNFYVKGTSNGSVDAKPDSKTVSGITYQTQYSFVVNATFNNTGNATMRNVNMTIIPEYSGAWTTSSNYSYDCGNLSAGSYCYHEFIIDLPQGASPGGHDVIFNVSWMNPDYTNDYATDTVDVTVASNPILSVDETLLADVISHGNSANVGNFTIDSLGNTYLIDVAYSANGGNLQSSWITFDPVSGTQTIISAGGNLTVDVDVDIPSGQSPGNYWTWVNVSSSNGGNDSVKINITVPTDTSWSRTPVTISETTPTGTSGNFYINVTNRGNVNLLFSIVGSGNATSMLSIPSSLEVIKQTTDQIVIGYTVPPDQTEGVYSVDITIQNNTATPVSYHSYIYMTVQNVPPTISSPKLGPSEVDVGLESTTINATVTDNGYVDSVWINVTRPDNTTEIKNMENSHGDFYNTTYEPSQVGNHTIFIYARDNKGLISNYSFNLVSIGNTSVIASSNVSSISFNNITQSNGASFGVNISVNNTGSGGAYGTNVTFILPNEWSANTNLTLGDILEGSLGSGTSLINVSAGTSPGTYTVYYNVTWSNPDGSVGNDLESINVIIGSNQLFEISESLAGANITHNTSKTINITLNSTGNDVVSGISLSCVGGYCDNFSVSLDPGNVSSLAAGATRTVGVTTNVPEGFDPGNYSFILYANNSEMSDSVNISVEVPISRNWTRVPSVFDQVKVGTDTSADLGMINITNLGNVPISLNISIVNTSNGQTVGYMNTNVTNFTVGKLSTYSVLVNYTAPSTGGVYNATIRIYNSIASPSELNVTTSLDVTEFKINITSPVESSPLTNIVYNDTINISAYLTYGGSPLNENITFSVEVGGSECPVQNYTSSGGGIWNISCSAPNVNDAASHDLKVSAYYTSISSTSVDLESDAVAYKDVTAPIIEDIVIPSVQYGQNTTINVSVVDNLLTDSVWMTIVYPNGSITNLDLVNTSGNLTSTYWVNNITGINEVGDYDVVVFANDSLVNLRNDSSWFEVYSNSVTFSGTFSDADGDTYPVNMSFYRANHSSNSDNLIFNESVGGSGTYSSNLHNRSYDILFEVFGHKIFLRNVSIPSGVNSPILFDEVPTPQALSPSDIASEVDLVLTAVGVQTVLEPEYSELTFDFSGTSYTDIGLISVYKCSNWTFSSRTCNSGWFEIGGTVNNSAETITVTVDSFSAYAVVQEEESSSSSTSESSTSSGGSSGGGGGGASIGAIRELFGEITSPPEFDVKTDLIEATLHPGESKMYSLWVSNNLDKDTTAEIKVTGPVWEFVQLESTKLDLGPKSTESTKIKLFTLPTTLPGIYTGDIVVTMDGKVKNIPITLLVTPEKEALMDVKVEAITKSVTPGGNLKFHVSLYNLGFRKKFDVHLKYTIKTAETEELVIWKEEELALENSLSFVRVFDLSEELDEGGIELGKYLIEATATYENKTASSVDAFEVVKPFFSPARKRTFSVIGLILFILILGYYGWKYYKKWKLSKARYLFPVSMNKLPTGKMWLGNIAETDKKARFSFDDLSTHMIVAGSTGSGKSVTSMVFAEEALNNKLPVIVFDPTAQWTGFVRPCKDENFLNRYSKFGLKKDDARSFKGMIYEFDDPNAEIDLKKYMNPGEITVFSLAKLTVDQFDDAVTKVIKTIFKQNWEESPHLKVLLIFDEVHRLLDKYGGKGGGYTALEKATREFRKWGIGIILSSQVLSDFKDAIKGNVLTEVQMHTKSLDDIKRVTTKYGKEYAERITRQEIGVGMLQNPKYNNGKPYFIAFRPLLHSPHKLPEKDLKEYARLGKILDEIESKIMAMKKKGKDTTDIELELKLAKDKLKQGRYRMTEIYLDSLKRRLK